MGFLGAILRAPKSCKFGFVVTNPNPYGMRFLYLKTSQRSETRGAFAYFSHRKVGAPSGATRKLEL
jgi:P pilus assembly chaperone PapD